MPHREPDRRAKAPPEPERLLTALALAQALGSTGSGDEETRPVGAHRAGASASLRSL
jgi:hypothetical protein